MLNTIPGTQLFLMSLPAGMSLEEGAAFYQTSGLVEDRGVGRNYQATLANYPNDPYFPSQWHLYNTGQNGGIPNVDIGALYAWDKTVGAPGVVVAVLDSCFDSGNPDLVFTAGTNVGDGNGNWSCAGVYDQNSQFHGTEVAGVIGARGNNGYGVTGVAWNVTMVPVRMTRSRDSNFGTFEILAALRYAVAIGAHLVNLSSSVTLSSQSTSDINYWVKQFDDATGRGTSLIVIAAGNNNYDLNSQKSSLFYWPIQINRPWSLVVAATNELDQLMYGTNVGSNYVEISAPGQDILTTVPTWTGSPAGWSHGTSYAAPIVTGVGALGIATHPSIAGSAFDVKLLLAGSAQYNPNIPWNAVAGSRKVNALAAVNW